MYVNAISHLSRSRTMRSLALLALLIAFVFFHAISFAAQPNAVPKTSPKTSIEKPSYWVSKLKDADEPVLTASEIDYLNNDIFEKNGQMARIDEMPDLVSGERLIEWLSYDQLPSVTMYDENGARLDVDFFSSVWDNMDLEGVLENNPVEFGVVADRADLRAFPTETAVMKRPGKGEFDYFQYSSVYPSEEVALLHTSKDGKWGFFQTSTVRGWMRLDKVAFGEADTVVRDKKDFVVVTGSYIDIHADKDLSLVLTKVTMGRVFNIVREEEDHWEVEFPHRSFDGRLSWAEAYISKKADVSRGFLPYTKRNVIVQAFKMLGEEYGWGGKDGKRDCSLFVKDLFATMGIQMPRNSRQQQEYAGTLKASVYNLSTKKELNAALKSAEPGITLIGMNRHIMLYIGERKGMPYVIHQVFGFRSGKRMAILKKVAVTGLEAGKRSRNSLKQRIKSINELTIASTPSA